MALYSEYNLSSNKGACMGLSRLSPALIGGIILVLVGGGIAAYFVAVNSGDLAGNATETDDFQIGV